MVSIVLCIENSQTQRRTMGRRRKKGREGIQSLFVAAAAMEKQRELKTTQRIEVEKVKFFY